jgi:hypothetical protein
MTMSTKDEERKGGKEEPGRVKDKDLKQAAHADQASKTTTPAQEIEDDEVTIAKTGNKP